MPRRWRARGPVLLRFEPVNARPSVRAEAATANKISTMNIRKQLEYRLRVRRSSKNEFVCTTTSGRPSQGPLELRGRLPPSRMFFGLPVAQVLLQARERKHVGIYEVGDHLCGNQPVSWVHDEAAVLAQSSGEEPAPPRYRAGVASMAWR